MFLTARTCILVVIMTVVVQPADFLSSLFLIKIKPSFLHAGISIAGAEEANPAAPASHATTTAVPAMATGETPTTPSPPQEGQPSPESPQAPKGQQPPAATEAPQKPEAGSPQEGFVDTVHGSLSRQIQDTAVWLDSFFTNESFLKEQNRSYVRIRYDVFKEQGTSASMKPSIDLRLALPELERKSHLIFTAEPAQPPVGTAAPAQTAGERFGTTEQQNVTAGVHYIFRQATKESFVVRSGMQFSKFTPVVFAAPRYRALFALDSWNMRFTQELLWRSTSGWQTDTRFEFERLLRPEFFFRTSIDGIWAGRVNGYLYSIAFSLTETINPTHAIDYELINNFQASPGQLTEVDFLIRYRHSFWRKWLFFEVAPQVRFPRDRKFEDTPGILFRIEMFFGEVG